MLAGWALLYVIEDEQTDTKQNYFPLLHIYTHSLWIRILDEAIKWRRSSLLLSKKNRQRYAHTAHPRTFIHSSIMQISAFEKMANTFTFLNDILQI